MAASETVQSAQVDSVLNSHVGFDNAHKPSLAELRRDKINFMVLFWQYTRCFLEKMPKNSQNEFVTNCRESARVRANRFDFVAFGQDQFAPNQGEVFAKYECNP